ncbi:MAG: T9SS type A sorting domain-containing protein [Candidatus Glassbacteria bacterium]
MRKISAALLISLAYLSFSEFGSLNSRQNRRLDFPNPGDREYMKTLRNERARFENQQRCYPFGSFPIEKQLASLDDVRSMRIAVNLHELPEWEPIGPGNIGGRLNAIAIDPLDDAVIYVGGVSSGVWKTTNGGNSWTPLSDDLPSLSIGALAVDPLDPAIVYAGTGEENFIGQYGCKPYRSDQYPGAGVFKSTDGGVTWTQAGEYFSESMARIAIHPLGTDTLFVASVDGLFKSTDAGENWGVSIPGIATDVLIDPDSPNIVYCAMGKPDGDPANGIYKSTDGGRTWVRKTTGLPSPQEMGRVMLALAANSHDNQWIYANLSYVYTPLGVYRSTDGAETWSNTGFDWAGDCYKNATIADPLDSLTAYTGGLELYKTTDGGSTWTELTQWWEGITPYDQQLMAWGNDLTSLYNVSDRGIFKSTDGGWNWIDLDNELEVTQFQSIALHPTERFISIGGTQDRGTLLFMGDPQSWEQIYPADGGVTVIDYVTPTTIFTEYVYLSLLKSTDMGENWDDATIGIDYEDDVGFYAPYVMDSNNHLIMYAGTDRIYKTTNGAGLWTPISTDLTKDLGFYESYVSAIAVSEVDPMVIYAGTSDGNFHASTDGGDNWLPRNDGLPNRFVMDIAIDPDDAGHVYTTFSGYDTTHVWESADYGVTWNDISSNLPDIPVNTIVLPRGRFTYPGTIYIGTDFSCFKTTDNGGSWFPFNNGLPNTVIEDMAFHETLGFIRAATQGRSVFDVFDTTATSIVIEEDPPLPRGFTLDQNYPNPFNPKTTISYSLPEGGYVKLDIYNLKGQRVKRLDEGVRSSGKHSLTLDGKDLPSGVYFYRLELTEGDGVTHTKTRKLLLVK